MNTWKRRIQYKHKKNNVDNEDTSDIMKSNVSSFICQKGKANGN